MKVYEHPIIGKIGALKVPVRKEKISQQTTVSTTEESQNTETKNITTVIPAPIVVHTIYQETKNHLP